MTTQVWMVSHPKEPKGCRMCIPSGPNSDSRSSMDLN
uniref:Uncharacterized protein n=1 Tax=Nelumbo nucifera TaxID=4432 RepID=A0A822Z3D0_NELNU|nr:TPA_asm: hypothetical protein HUJ06_008616 [Nelumbo nucifera]